MGKVLQAVVYVILVLSAVSLFFASMLFDKRELLQSRNEALVEQITNIARTIEEKDADDAEAPEIAKDVSEVSEREITVPEKQNALEGYDVKLETANLGTFNLGTEKNRRAIHDFYVVDDEGNAVLDPVTKLPDCKGPGSMNALLDRVFDRAKAQQANLNKTRSELTKMREKLASEVAELNKRKSEQRLTLKELKETKDQIVKLEGEKQELDDKNSKLQREKKELNAELADQKDQNEKLQEEKQAVQEDLEKVQAALRELQDKFKNAGKTRVATSDESVIKPSAVTAGDKGKIVSVNDDLKFCIVEFTNEAIAELLGTERDRALPQLEFNVRRKGYQSASGEFITRIKLRQAVAGRNFVIADILFDWQQTKVEKDDVVFF